jgi:hypothetical protein
MRALQWVIGHLEILLLLNIVALSRLNYLATRAILAFIYPQKSSYIYFAT